MAILEILARCIFRSPKEDESRKTDDVWSLYYVYAFRINSLTLDSDLTFNSIWRHNTAGYLAYLALMNQSIGKISILLYVILVILLIYCLNKCRFVSRKESGKIAQTATEAPL